MVKIIDIDEDPEAFDAAYEAELAEEDAENRRLRGLPPLTKDEIRQENERIFRICEDVLGPLDSQGEERR